MVLFTEVANHVKNHLKNVRVHHLNLHIHRSSVASNEALLECLLHHVQFLRIWTVEFYVAQSEVRGAVEVQGQQPGMGGVDEASIRIQIVHYVPKLDCSWEIVNKVLVQDVIDKASGGIDSVVSNIEMIHEHHMYIL